MGGLLLFATSSLATGVEMVEALTIILATGVTRSWRSTLIGGATAALILAATIAVFGATLTDTVPLPVLQIVVGAFLLIFGLQWLRKAIMRSSGLMAYHDEAKIYSREVQALRGAAAAEGALDWIAFVVASKGVLLEGLEAAFIVITFGMAAQNASLLGFSGVGLAALGAGAALLVVLIAGLLVHRPLSTVPENTMKYAVGLLLVAFGTFWAGEGVGLEWDPGDATILLLLGFYALASWAMVFRLPQVRRSREAVGGSRAGEAPDEVPALLVRLPARGCLGSRRRHGRGAHSGRPARLLPARARRRARPRPRRCCSRAARGQHLAGIAGR